MSVKHDNVLPKPISNKHEILVLFQQLNNSDKCSAVAELGDRLATTDMGQKLGGLYTFLGEELGLHL